MTRMVRAAAIAGACASHRHLPYPTRSARAGQSPARCDRGRLGELDVPGLAIQTVETVAAGAFAPPRSNTSIAQTRSFCRVQATVSSTPDSRIVFEVWIPERWNGKTDVTGNGGYSNALTYPDMALALSEGYAAIGGDTGHQTPTPDDLLWGVDHPQRIIDWGTASIHTIIEPAKTYHRTSRRMSTNPANYYGCSTGGHQGYAEIQRVACRDHCLVDDWKLCCGNDRRRIHALVAICDELPQKRGIQTHSVAAGAPAMTPSKSCG